MRSEQLISAVALIGATVIFNVGCVAHARGSASAHAEVAAPVVFVEPPTLVQVDSDVWVVRDHDQAVYYVDGYYWVHRDGVWHRSTTYEGGWATVTVSAVPTVIARRDHRAYVRFRGTASARTRTAPRERGAADSSPPPSPAPAAEAPRHGPPDHAAAKHGGPPGLNETPGLGNQRKAEKEQPSAAPAAEAPRHGPPDHAAAKHGGPPGLNETPAASNQPKAEKKETPAASNQPKAEKKETPAASNQPKAESGDAKKPEEKGKKKK
jgi:hypothetical protein